ncbi:right-handed parallel beta-helix repeat-containing protein [Microbulbifer sp. SSSA008]|uniref:right-handed parallel beta-helix repeat-containing protein n=1 Tax=Microbulbifer sp. SSSA008 TaxID=3243380 RepID=UPI004039AD60
MINFQKSYKISTFTAILFVASNSATAVNCGDTITTPTVLTENLTCPIDIDNQNGLIVEGPSGSLYMNGYTLTCNLDNLPLFTDAAGIRITGMASLVTDGTVNNCNYGIFVVGTGFHTISDMTITNSLEDGIDLRSDNNTAIKNHIQFSGEDGIDMQGDFSSVIQNYIEFSDRDGIEADNDFGTVAFNFVTGSQRAGIEMEASDNNTIVQNTVMNNGDGISGDSGGIVITSQSSSNNLILGNTAENNLPFDLKDRIDPNCTGSNQWVANNFVTADPACLE